MLADLFQGNEYASGFVSAERIRGGTNPLLHRIKRTFEINSSVRDNKAETHILRNSCVSIVHFLEPSFPLALTFIFHVSVHLSPMSVVVSLLSKHAVCRDVFGS